MIINYIYLFAIIITANIAINDAVDEISINVCNDWVAYEKQKCLKVIAERASQETALNRCQRLDSRSRLVYIDDDRQQQFAVKLLANYSQIADRVWLGNQVTAATTPYSNWADGSPDYIPVVVTESGYNNGYNSYGRTSRSSSSSGNSGSSGSSARCVQMSVTRNHIGKWYDEPCKRRALIVCERSQEWTINILSTALENITRLVNKHEQQLAVAAAADNNSQPSPQLSVQLSSIPIGFVYIQLANQSEPHQLWPLTNWQQISDQYAGLVFRAAAAVTAAGNDSSSDGQFVANCLPKQQQRRIKQNLLFTTETGLLDKQEVRVAIPVTDSSGGGRGNWEVVGPWMIPTGGRVNGSDSSSSSSGGSKVLVNKTPTTTTTTTDEEEKCRPVDDTAVKIWKRIV
ncbi:uncharacterized protein LOC128955123 [Oppia nitens]|uniref:uncharacterized protein LOC128955123 n=1 Tax=Oppia nitens TaxID=1686743 RepID=UPI0023DC6240|nr:uncharacterized protein LOC128955123 [Oppia nitens]